MLVIFVIFLSLFFPIDCKFTIEHFAATDNPSYLVTHANLSSNGVLDITSEMIKQLKYKIMAKVSAYSLTDQTRNLIVSVPKFNYCDITRQIRVVPFISQGLAELAKYRDSRMGCPMKAKQRFKLTNFTIAEAEYSILDMVQAKDRQRYLLEIVITDENKLPPKMVVKYEVFLMFMK